MLFMPYAMLSYVMQATSAAQASLPVVKHVRSAPPTPSLAWLSATSATRDTSGGAASLHARHVLRHMCQTKGKLGVIYA